MGIAQNQAVPDRVTEPSKWTMRPLLSTARRLANTISKIFIDPMDALFAFIVLVMGIGNLFGVRISAWFYVFAMLMLGAIVYRNQTKPININTKENK